MAEKNVNELIDIITRIITLTKQNPYTHDGFQVKFDGKGYEIFIDSKTVFSVGNGEVILPDFFEMRIIRKEETNLANHDWSSERKVA